MTRSEIRAMARKGLGETTAAFWTDAELNTYINVGCKDIAWLTKSLRASGLMSVASCVENTVGNASNEYVLSTFLPNFFAVNEVYHKLDGTQFTRLLPTQREELDIINPSWQSLVGITETTTAGVTTYNLASQPSVPIYYYWNREEDVLGLYPPPDDDQSGTNYLKVYYTKNHPDLSSDTETPTLPTPLHLGIVEFVIAKGLEDRGWGDRANDFWRKYQERIRDYRINSRVEREDDEIISKNYRNI